MDFIEGGFFLVSRKIINSGIMDKPPDYLKVWLYLLAKAHHSPKNNLKRGQGFTSIPELIDLLSYKVGYRTVTPSKKKVWGIIEWLRNPNEGNGEGNNEGNAKEPMIETTKVTHGFVYTICNYNVYQEPKNYERNNEGNNEGNYEGNSEGNAKDTNKYKNDKNDKNEKNDKKERIIESNNHVSKMDTRCTQNVSIDNHHSMIKYDADHQYYKIAIFIRQKILLINDKAKVPKDDPSSMSKWSDDVRKIVELDKRTLAEFQELTEFAFKSDFWSTVIQSPAGFRKNWDKMFAQMKRPKSSYGNVISFDRQMEVCREFLEEG